MSSASQNTSGRKPYYMLRHVHTGNLMPQRQTGKGYTHTDPKDTGAPRLFLTARGAKCCATAWERGKMACYYTQNSDSDWITKPVPGRDKHHWVVEEIII